jgi:acetylornithine deacetylase/succinyl-diaminopimelate desuccinylase-like protein
LYEILKNVDENNLYRNIIEMMGPNDPVFNQDKLDAAADYITSRFDEYGLQVYEHVFEIEGREYRNIEGLISTGEGSELLLTSHYDTVPKAPGADDNLSGTSVMLESARILAEASDPLNVRFVGFTLEEGHPKRFAKELASAQELGLMDDHFNFKNLSTQILWKSYGNISFKVGEVGKGSEIALICFSTNARAR